MNTLLFSNIIKYVDRIISDTFNIDTHLKNLLDFLLALPFFVKFISIIGFGFIVFYGTRTLLGKLLGAIPKHVYVIIGISLLTYITFYYL